MPIHKDLNTELLLKVKKHILEEPKRLLMNYYLVKEGLEVPGDIKNGKFTAVSAGWGEPKTVQMPSCKTIGCIAGWTCLLNNPNIDFKRGFQFEYEAQRLLNIKDDNLFFVSHWPYELSSKYLIAKTRKQRAIIVGQAIDAYINGEF